MTARPQNTAQNHPESLEFTLLGAFEDEGVIQQSNNRRIERMSLSEGVAQVDALIRLLEARKAGRPAAASAALRRLRAAVSCETKNRINVPVSKTLTGFSDS